MNQNDMEKKLDQLLAGLPKPQYDTDQWLVEDHTAEFDRIVGQRRRKVWTRRWAVAAVVVGLLSIVGVTLQRQTETPLPPVAQTTPVVTPQPIAQTEAPKPAEALPTVKAPAKVKRTRKPAVAQAPATSMTPIDSLTDLMASIEESMQGIRDSCYRANVEKLIRADDRLQRLVNNLIIEGIVTEEAAQTASVNPENSND